MGEKVNEHKRYGEICRQLNVKRNQTDTISNFKLQAYLRFNEMVQKEFKIERNIEIEEEKPSASRVFKAYIGKGNNWQVVKNTLKYRNWWTLVGKCKKDTNFVWTQWLKHKILKSLPEGAENSDIALDPCINTSMMYNRIEGNHQISNK